ncbi:G-type lectin S-receptor-like serine/threonine-protein kinase At4g27290 [Cryptomeria japonica]|uniref:G-type lectin S-receptor-like serine/threonine-protein kinase At4g27290 n=1 Tax=Cryptomeria japonica TaxID=3369 RepID=UPI0027DA7456|nr:G-type lectin S-receptor-like serine/threonine-protein kinase At4g27290 [Cryptomeria japonica]
METHEDKAESKVAETCTEGNHEQVIEADPYATRHGVYESRPRSVTIRLRDQKYRILEGDTLPVGTALAGNQTVVSKNGTFAFGFFNANGTNNWYVGIWYARVSEKTIVLVANRENPVRNMPGLLNLSRDGYLRLFDLQGRSIWSSDNSLKASQASLLESGNLVMLGARAGNSSEIVWESFQHPVDTWLPGMKMWKGMKLTSWKSSADPAPGPFSFQMDPSPGKTQFLLLSHNTVPYWSTGEWNGQYFANMPGFARAESGVKMEFITLSPSRMYSKYTTPSMAMGHEILINNGELWGYYMMRNGLWRIHFAPRDQCNVYGVCGANTACNGYSTFSSSAYATGNTSDTCTCLQGFRPKNRRALDSQEWWSSGCVRRSPLQCSVTNSTDGFLQVKDKHLADDEAVPYSKEQTLHGCQLACLNNCSCMTFLLTTSSPPLCQLWFGDLMNVRNSSGGQSFYLRLAASELRDSTSKQRNRSSGL